MGTSKADGWGSSLGGSDQRQFSTNQLLAPRIRHARGGRWFIDKHLPSSWLLSIPDVSKLLTFRRQLHEEDSDDERDGEDEERAWRLAER
jgi:hypothetical protein